MCKSTKNRKMKMFMIQYCLLIATDERSNVKILSNYVTSFIWEIRYEYHLVRILQKFWLIVIFNRDATMNNMFFESPYLKFINWYVYVTLSDTKSLSHRWVWKLFYSKCYLVYDLVSHVEYLNVCIIKYDQILC